MVSLHCSLSSGCGEEISPPQDLFFSLALLSGLEATEFFVFPSEVIPSNALFLSFSEMGTVIFSFFLIGSPLPILRAQRRSLWGPGCVAVLISDSPDLRPNVRDDYPRGDFTFYANLRHTPLAYSFKVSPCRRITHPFHSPLVERVPTVFFTSPNQ